MEVVAFSWAVKASPLAVVAKSLTNSKFTVDGGRPDYFFGFKAVVSLFTRVKINVLYVTAHIA